MTEIRASKEPTDAGNVDLPGWHRGFPHGWFLLVGSAMVVLLAVAWVAYPSLSHCPWSWTAPVRQIPGGNWPIVITIYLLGLVWGHALTQAATYVFDVLTTLELKGDRRTEALNGRTKAIRHLPNTFPAAAIGAGEAIFYPTSLY